MCGTEITFNKNLPLRPNIPIAFQQPPEFSLILTMADPILQVMFSSSWLQCPYVWLIHVLSVEAIDGFVQLKCTGPVIASGPHTLHSVAIIIRSER